MKKLLPFIILTIFVGCATTQPRPSSYVIPNEILHRVITITIKVQRYVAPERSLRVLVSPLKEPNAWLDGEGGIVFTEGLFRYDDETLIFVTAHEMSHDKLGHSPKRKALSWGVSISMSILDLFVPGAGYLDYLVNPLATNTYSREQEFEADKEASRACVRMGIPIERQVAILENMKRTLADGGGLWDQHPSWDDRIANIRAP